MELNRPLAWRVEDHFPDNLEMIAAASLIFPHSSSQSCPSNFVAQHMNLARQWPQNAGSAEPLAIQGALWMRVVANVVDNHRLRIGQAAGRSSKRSTHGHVQECEDVLIERPHISRRKVAWGHREER